MGKVNRKGLQEFEDFDVNWVAVVPKSNTSSMRVWEVSGPKVSQRDLLRCLCDEFGFSTQETYDGPGQPYQNAAFVYHEWEREDGDNGYLVKQFRGIDV